MTFRVTLVCAGVLFSCVATVSSGSAAAPNAGLTAAPQTEGAPSSDDAAKPDLHARLEKLKRDKDIRVQHTTLGLLDGKFSSVTSESMVMVVETPDAYETYTMQFSDVDTVWKRQGYTGWGLLVGAVVGGAIGAAVPTKQAEPGWFTGLEEGLERTGKIFVGVLIGAVVGSVVGHQIHSYSLIYP